MPGVLVVHDWLGVTDATRMRCDMLARLGYAAFAADVYGADTRPSEGEAAGVAGRFYGDQGTLARAASTRRSTAWRRSPRSIPTGSRPSATASAAPRRSSSPGPAHRCARSVSFHGGLQTGPAGEAERIRAKLLVLTGGADPHVPDESVVAFEEELRGVPAIDWQVVTYSGAMHAFTVPTADTPEYGAAYDERADRRSWTAMKDFFAETL